jgi:hypothetical protein
MTIDIVDFPFDSMVIFHSYVTVYQRVYHGIWYIYEYIPMYSFLHINLMGITTHHG